MTTYKITVIVGSLRKESFNRKIAEELISISPGSLQMELLEIGDLNLFNQDLDDGSPPESWTRFRNALKESDGVLFASPEYNRSIPGVLKNAIDVGSRPYGKNAWEGMPGAVISTTIGGYGAFGANHILRQSMVFLDVPMMQQPEAYLSDAHSIFDEEGNIQEETKLLLHDFISAYGEWVSTILD